MALRVVNSLFPVSSVVRPLFCNLSNASLSPYRPCPFLSHLMLSRSTTHHLCRYRFHGTGPVFLVSPLSTDTVLRTSGTHSVGDQTVVGGVKEKQDFILIPDPPTNCCMSGCANCVWLSYAQELLEIYKDGGQVAQEVLQAIEDPSIKAFLTIELREALKEKNK